MPAEFKEIPPRAAAVLHSLRAIGYDLPTAIADVVDNSLAAGASRVRVNLRFDAGNSHIRIEDNGAGMTALQLEDAMRLGTTHPGAERAATDHGRFGLGLKTASFGQCKRLTVRTLRAGGDSETRSWDLDHVEQQDSWALRTGAWDGASEARLGTVPGESGTIVLWEKLDRVLEKPDLSGAHADFDRKILETRDHLSMVFHRLIDATSGPVTIEVNGVKLEGWDPLFSKHKLTRQRPDARLALGGSVIQISPYIIPPESLLSPEEARRAAGPHGLLAHQGFYLYRNRRLLVTGGWLGLARRDPQCSLARIRLDVDNRLDELLRIDVRKARARIPDQIREQVQKIVEKTRTTAIEAWRGHAVSRAAPAPQKEIVSLWLMDAAGVKPRLRINPGHPSVEALRSRTGEASKAFDALLLLIGNSVPVDILMQMAGAPPPSAIPLSDDHLSDELRVATHHLVTLMKSQEVPRAEIISRLGLVEPWSSMTRSVLETLVERIE